MLNAYISIDGNNVYHNLKCMGINPGNIAFDKLSKFVCSHFGCLNKKIFYYNSIPNIATGKETYYNHIKFLSKLRNIGIEVKTRKLQKRSNLEVLQQKQKALENLKLCGTCKPLVESNCADCVGDLQIKEKGIDIMIAVDMLYYSVIKDECDCCVLISGDADFVPCLKLIEQNGKKVFSSFFTKGYSNELRTNFKFLILDNKTLKENCFK